MALSNLQFETSYKFRVSFGVLLILFPFVYSYILLTDNFGIFIGNDMVSTFPEKVFVTFENKVNIYSIFCHEYTFCAIYSLSIAIGIYFLREGLFQWKHGDVMKDQIARDIVEMNQDSSKFLDSENDDEKEDNDRNTSQTVQRQQLKDSLDENTKEEKNTSNTHQRNQLNHFFHHEEELIENACGELLRYQLGKHYDIYTNVRISNDARGIGIADIIAMPKLTRGGDDIIYEVKVGVRSVRFLERTIQKLEKNCENYRLTMGRKCSAILLTVVPEKEIEQFIKKLSSYKDLVQAKGVELEIVSKESLDKFIFPSVSLIRKVF